MSMYRQATQLLKDAEFLFGRKSFTSAGILAAKSVFAFSDDMLFSKSNLLVSDHKKRFNAFRFNFPELAFDLADAFDIYRSAYRKNLTQMEAKKVIDVAKKFSQKS